MEEVIANSLDELSFVAMGGRFQEEMEAEKCDNVEEIREEKLETSMCSDWTIVPKSCGMCIRTRFLLRRNGAPSALAWQLDCTALLVCQN